jgi:hypothetical protein
VRFRLRLGIDMAIPSNASPSDVVRTIHDHPGLHAYTRGAWRLTKHK